MLVAASGGVDSTVLAHALGGLRERCRLTLALGHVHHGLRGAEADADREAVADLAARLSVPFHATQVDPRALRRDRSSRERPTVQEAARTLRYRALLRLCEEAGCERIATAHNADDQAETVLLRLLRGCGPDGLGGIPEVSQRGRVVRPLLSASREQIHAYARHRGLEWREDASNRDVRYARNRLRSGWMQRLAADFNPQLLRAIGNLAEAQRRDAEWIEQLVSSEVERRFRWEGEALVFARGDWGELPEALVRRLARRALLEFGAGRDVSRAHLQRFVAFVRRPRRGAVLELPGDLRLCCDSEVFRLRRDRVKAQTPC